MLPKNFIIIISAPSGAGKSTLVRMLLEKDKKIKLSVSDTTRNMREGEVEGVQYHFLSVAEFQEKVRKNGYLEHAKVFDNYYGTSKLAVKEMLESGYDVLLEIDWQGARQISACFDKTKLLKIFIMPPSIEALEKRLRNRKQDSEEVIQKRMNKAKNEMSHSHEYDYVVMNDDLDVAVKKLCSIIEKKRKELKTI